MASSNKIEQQPCPKKITRLVCSGGGAKGVIYAGAYEALTNTGVMDGITDVAGASAGAISAAFIAVGMTAVDFRQALLETNLPALMGSRVAGTLITKDGAPLLELMRDKIKLTVLNYLNTANKAELKTSVSVSPDTTEPRLSRSGIPLANARGSDLSGATMIDPELNILNILTDIQKNLSLDPPGPFTFRDLATLSRISKNKFKNLTVTAVTYPDGKLQVFNSTLTPDIEIAVACRASASIPILLQPQKIMMPQKANMIFSVTDSNVFSPLPENNGTPFIDGGLYDNLPSNYFDEDKGKFTQNNKKDETLILAFGEGLDDKKNPVLQALTNSDLIPDAFLDVILTDAIESKQPLIKAVNQRLTHDTNALLICPREANLIKDALSQLPQPLINNISDVTKLREDIKDQFKIKQNLDPRLYHASYFEQFKRNIIVAWLGGFRANYKNTERKEVGYQKLSKEYRNQTIELRVGTIETTDFDKAQVSAREIAAMGYLDTINYLYNHNMITEEKQPDPGAILVKFKLIYTAILLATKQNPETDNLLNNIKTNERNPRIIIQELIKPQAEKNFQSVISFALSRAVEWQNEHITEAALLIQTHAKSRSVQLISNTNFDRRTSNALVAKYKYALPSSSLPETTQKRSEVIAQCLFKPNN